MFAKAGLADLTIPELEQSRAINASSAKQTGGSSQGVAKCLLTDEALSFQLQHEL
jgi:hypothetical protein